MRWALALLVTVLIGTVATVVYVVLEERDPVPDDLEACALEKVRAARVDGVDSLGPMRVDLLRDRLVEGDTVTLSNGYRVTQLVPRDGGYVTIVLKAPDQFDLPTLETVRDRPSLFTLVARAQGAGADALLACVDEQR
jgi:hypothetical protein